MKPLAWDLCRLESTSHGISVGMKPLADFETNLLDRRRDDRGNAIQLRLNVLELIREHSLHIRKHVANKGFVSCDVIVDGSDFGIGGSNVLGKVCNALSVHSLVTVNAVEPVVD